MPQLLCPAFGLVVGDHALGFEYTVSLLDDDYRVVSAVVAVATTAAGRRLQLPWHDWSVPGLGRCLGHWIRSSLSLAAEIISPRLRCRCEHCWVLTVLSLSFYTLLTFKSSLHPVRVCL